MKTVAIDRFGRVLIPKPVRDQLNLHKGQEMTLHIEAGKLVLAPNLQEQVQLVDGFPVFDVEGQTDIGDALAWARAERDKEP